MTRPTTPKALTKKRARPANTAQDVDPNTWYYEYRGRIELVVRYTNEHGHTLATIRKIPWRKLMESARRCRPEEVKLPPTRTRRTRRPT